MSTKEELTALDEAAYGNQAAEREICQLRAQRREYSRQMMAEDRRANELQAELLKKDEEIASFKKALGKQLDIGEDEFVNDNELLGIVRTFVVGCERQRQRADALQSWQESVLAEVDCINPAVLWHTDMPLKNGGFVKAATYYSVEQMQHVAAKLVEASNAMVSLRSKLSDHVSLADVDAFDAAIAKLQSAPTGDSYTTRHEVMNPPASAARGAEARNLNSANVMGLGEVHRASKARPANDVPAPSTQTEGRTK